MKTTKATKSPSPLEGEGRVRAAPPAQNPADEQRKSPFDTVHYRDEDVEGDAFREWLRHVEAGRIGI
jgi:hypothetical protein